jgi:halogenation protein CepH
MNPNRIRVDSYPFAAPPSRGKDDGEVIPMVNAGGADGSADVVVIGGGPAGSTAATMLARKGLRVLLLERERFPRDHIGESLLPASMPVLEELGVLPTVRGAGFLPKWGATMVWGTDPAPWSWYFRETNKRYPHAFQVWRPQFDQLLLENSRDHGVDVREGHQVVEVLFDDAAGSPAGAGPAVRASRATGVRYVTDGREGIARARFVVDASGQQALLGRRLGLRRWDDFFRNLAVYAYFEGAARLPPPDETNILVESYPHGWFWNIPLHTGWMSTGAVVDSQAGQEGLRRAGPRAFLEEQIAQAPHTRALLARATLVYGPFVLKDWSYVSDEVAGDGYVLAGDAACFVDPLFSSGVHLALMSGVLAAAYVTTALKHPDLRAPAGGVYKELYYRQYGHFREMARLFYASNRTVESYFWEARRILGADDRLSPRHAFIQAVAGQSPLGYERVVLERGEAPPAFVAGVRAVEAERAARRDRLDRATAAGALARAVPRLVDGVTVQRKPVLADGEFVWGHVLTTAGYPEGMPCSGFVAALVTHLDGRTPVARLVERLQALGDPARGDDIARSALTALGILYVDGTVELEGIP